jgi:ABC-2 type transport system permease protein
MADSFKKYFKSWLIMTSGAAQIVFQSRFGAGIFILAKLLRYVFFLFFLYILTIKTKTIAGYSLWQVVLFYATYNLIDTASQLLFRDVYRFRAQILNGFFDYILLRPFSPLFKSLFGGIDLMDLPLLLLSLIFIFISFNFIGNISLENILLYLLLILNSLLIALSIHILVLGVGILTTSVDNAIMLYRDIAQMGRVPTELYLEPLRGFITFVIPVGVMMTFPPKALLGLLSLNFVLYSVIFSLVFLFFSLKFWRFSLKRYQSASS